MAEVLINENTGGMTLIPSNGNCGIKGNDLLTNPNYSVKLIGGDLAYHFSLNHCIYEDGEIIIKPEEEWFENQVNEEEFIEDEE